MFYNDAIVSIVNLDFEKFDQLCKSAPTEIAYDLKLLRNLVYYGGQEKSYYCYDPLDSNPLVGPEKCLSLLIGALDLFYHSQNPSTSYRLFHKALACSNDNHEVIALKKLSLLSILIFYQTEYNQTDENYLAIIDELEEISNSIEDEFWAINYKIMLRSKSSNSKKWNNPILTSQLLDLIDNIPHDSNLRIFGEATYALQLEITGKIDQAKNVHEKLVGLIGNDKPFAARIKNRSLFRLAEISRQIGQYSKALEYIESAKKNGDYIDTLSYKMYLNYFSALSNRGLKKYDLAIEQLLETIQIEGQLALNQTAVQTSVLRTRLNALETQNDLLNEKYENQRLEHSLQAEINLSNRNKIIFALVSLVLILLSVIFILAYHNQKKKKIEIAKELEYSQKESQLVAVNARIDGEEDERQRLAQILHDQVAGYLGAIKFQLSEFSLTNKGASIQKPLQIISKVSEQIRDLSHDLYPPVLLKDGLLAAVSTLVEEYNSESLKFSFFSNSTVLTLEHDALKIYYIIQELLNNVVNHSGASKCEVSIVELNDEIFLAVRDNGQGFKNKSQLQKNLGLDLVRARIESMSGELIIQSEAKGTHIEIRL